MYESHIFFKYLPNFEIIIGILYLPKVFLLICSVKYLCISQLLHVWPYSRKSLWRQYKLSAPIKMNICWNKNKQKFEPRAILLQWLNFDYYLVIHKMNHLNLTTAYPFFQKIRLSGYIQSILKLPNNVFHMGKCSCLCLIINYIKLYGLYLLGKFSLY